MPASRDKESRMWELVDEMASSGKHINHLDIEWALRGRGYTRARELLDDERIRQRIDDACKKARGEL